MKRIAYAACTMFTLFAALALFTVGCATTGGFGGGGKAPEGYRYFCNCGQECDCGSSAVKPGNCACGKPMVLKKVLMARGSGYSVCGCPDCKCDAINPADQTQCSCGKPLKNYPNRGAAYVCACPGCDCDMRANVPAKCPCGVDLKPQQK